MKRKVLLVAGVVMLLAAVGFIIYALGHPEATFPWSNIVTYTVFIAYAAVMIALFTASFKKD